MDRRSKISWNMRLEEVSTVELIETQCINATAPVLLIQHLRPLFLVDPLETRNVQIVNVSAMVG